jgi:hypothetical protein
MKVATQIARHVRDVYFGDNWCGVNLKNSLADVTWQQATTKVINIVLIIRQSCLSRTGKNYWIKPGLMQKTLPALLNNCRRANLGKPLLMKNTGITTAIFTV